MSWDVVVFVPPDGVDDVDGLPRDYEPPSLGTPESVVQRVRAAFPDADVSDPTWLMIETVTFSIEVSVGPEDPVGTVGLFVRGGGDGTMTAVHALVAAIGGRGLDMQTGDFLDRSDAQGSLQPGASTGTTCCPRSGCAAASSPCSSAAAAKMASMQRVSDEQRRARLGVRQGLAPRTASVVAAVEAAVCLHATEAPTVYLSVAARSEATRDDVAAALYQDRSVVRQLAMRRTLFGFPRDLLPAVWGSASERVAGQLTARLGKEVEEGGIAKRGDAWVTRQTNAVLRAIEEHGPSTTAELRGHVPGLSRRLELGAGTKWGAVLPIGPRLVGALAASGRIVRGVNEGDWRTARPRWTLMQDWLGEPVEPLSADEGYRILVERWLRSFGPGTETDIVWWLGATKAAVRRALADLDAVEVGLDSGATGYLLPDDLDDVPEPEPWAALLPVLDPATMGWKERDFYLDPEDRPYLYDTNGNGGTTAWWGGRIVGCWVQDDDGAVRVVPRGQPGREAMAALGAEADRLTAWLAGDKVSTVYSSRQMKSAKLP